MSMTYPCVHVEMEKPAEPNMDIFYKWMRLKRPYFFFIFFLNGVILAQRGREEDH